MIGNMRLAKPLLVLLCLAACGWLYLHSLDASPVYLSLDEAHFGVHAHALATTGRNLNGDAWPLFIDLADPGGDQPMLPWGSTWYHPWLFYAIGAVLQVLPLTEASIRLPMAVGGGVVSSALIYGVAVRLAIPWGIALVAAMMLALCPANLIISRQALDYASPMVFTAGWLWCLSSFVREPGRGWSLALGLVLGLGCYSYVTSWAMMPLYLVMSWAVFVRTSPNAREAIVMSAVAFGVPLLLLVPWLWLHPGMLANLAAAYGIVDPQNGSVFQRLQGGVPMADVVRHTMSQYWSSFDPSFLFVTGGASRRVSTGQAGVFLLPVAILLPVGAFALLRRGQRSWVGLVLLAGLLAAPVPAALKGTPYAIERMMSVLPFAVLIAAFGLTWMWQARARFGRICAIALVLAQAVQFAGFYRDYLGDYRVRSAAAYDPTAFTEAAPFLVDSLAGGAPGLYLASPMYDVSAKWRFFATKLGRADLLSRTRYFDGDIALLPATAAGSLVVVPWNAAQVQRLTATGAWTLAKEVRNLPGDPTLAILSRR
jgi:4-amino-4-deoxy-L-arabinose transferase-like glycosyltransferase